MVTINHTQPETSWPERGDTLSSEDYADNNAIKVSWLINRWINRLLAKIEGCLEVVNSKLVTDRTPPLKDCSKDIEIKKRYLISNDPIKGRPTSQDYG